MTTRRTGRSLARRLAGAALGVGLLCGSFPAGAMAQSQADDPAGERLRQLDAPPVPRVAWRFEPFPILAWWAPPGDATQADFDRYRDAGFTLYPLNPDAGHDRARGMAMQAGLAILGFRTPQGFGLPPAEVDFARDDPAVVGWITHDEPGSPDDVAAAIRAVHALMAQDPTSRALFNFLPPHAQPAPGTEAAARAALANGLPILSYDHYVMVQGADAATEARLAADHFANLALFRRLALEHDVPFWAFALTIQHGHYRRPSESDVRWKQFTNLAYGAKGLWYFTYWGPTGWPGWDDKAIVDPKDGTPTELYKVVSDINHAVLAAGETLLGLTSTAVVHTRPPEGCQPFRPGDHWIAEVSDADVVIGFFTDTAGADYALVVNNRHGQGKSAADLAQHPALTFAADVKSVEALTWLDGPPTPAALPLQNRQATLPLAGGTGVLLKATR